MSTVTPNVVVSNPAVRKVMGWVIGVAAILFPALSVFDGRADWLDMSEWLDPTIATVSFLAGAFGLAVSIPNVGKPAPRGDHA